MTGEFIYLVRLSSQVIENAKYTYSFFEIVVCYKSKYIVFQQYTTPSPRTPPPLSLRSRASRSR